MIFYLFWETPSLLSKKVSFLMTFQGKNISSNCYFLKLSAVKQCFFFSFYATPIFLLLINTRSDFSRCLWENYLLTYNGKVFDYFEKSVENCKVCTFDIEILVIDERSLKFCRSACNLTAKLKSWTGYHLF